MSFLVTGFTAFGRFAANPAESIARRVAQRLSARFEPLEVSYDAVEQFVASLQSQPPDRWVMIGVAGNSHTLRIETLARNLTGATPDVRGRLRGSHPNRAIDPSLPPCVPGNFFDPLPSTLPGCCTLSEDAGDYLCNFVYHLARTRLPQTRSVFLHVAPTDRVPEDEQVEAILTLLQHAVPNVSARPGLRQVEPGSATP